MTLLASSGSAISSDLHWQCVAICAHPRQFGMTAIERHRLNRLIARYRVGCRMPKAEQHAVMRIVTACRARRTLLMRNGEIPPIRQRRGRKRKAD